MLNKSDSSRDAWCVCVCVFRTKVDLQGPGLLKKVKSRLTSGILGLFGQFTQGSSESGVCRLGNCVPIG